MNRTAVEMIRGRKTPFVVAGAAVLAILGAGAIAHGASEPSTPSDTKAMAKQGMDMGGMKMDTDGTVQLTPGQIRRFGVTFGTAEERTLENEVRTVGIVSFDETRIARVTPKFGGFIEKLYVDFTGQSVRAGQPLLEIYSPELVSAQEELLLATRLDESLGQSPVPGVGGSRTGLAASARRRLKLWDISDAQIDAILESGKVRRTLTLDAPVSGIVVEKQVVEGQAVQPGQSLYTIADLSEVWVEAELREADAGEVREGTAATVELNAFPGRPIRGHVEYVYPTLQAQARTLKARIALPNPDGRI
jgi:multidrug efflux pump subunit AcrA (membrane-fusion protein)